MTRQIESGRWARSFLALALLAWAIVIPSCGEGDDGSDTGPAQVAPPPPPPPSPLEDLRLDLRVQFPESQEPSTREIAEAVAEFASVLATGDATRAAEMMSEADRAVLERLIERGWWSTSEEGIELVRVVSLSEPSAGEVRIGLAIQTAEGAYLTAWSGQKAGGSWRFGALPIESTTAPNAREMDGIDLTSRLTR